MKMYLISDNIDTLTGMRLAGVDGVVVHERNELREAIENAMNDKTVGIILLTEKFGREFRHKNAPACTLQAFGVGFGTENSYFSIFAPIRFQPFKSFLSVV